MLSAVTVHAISERQWWYGSGKQNYRNHSKLERKKVLVVGNRKSCVTKNNNFEDSEGIVGRF